MSESKEIVELTFDKMEKYFDAAKGIIEQYGGDVAELGLMALRVDALSTLITGFFMAITVFVVHRMIPKSWWDSSKDRYHNTYRSGVKDESAYLWVVAVYAPSGIISIMGFFKLMDIWAWAGVVYPELYAVHKFILN